jgi:hypothetical protein
MLRRKLRQDGRLHSAEGFPAVKGSHALVCLRKLHTLLKPQVYLEIGTGNGESLSLASCTSVAVDASFALQEDVSRNKPEMHQFQGSSDAFFASRMLERLGLTVDFGVLGRRYLFETLLRDFINLEQRMQPTGIVALPDCVPINAQMAERDGDTAPTPDRVGDVWKIIPILRQYRPDLEVTVLDAAPTGLVVIRNLAPGNAVLSDHLDAIVAEFTPRRLDGLLPTDLADVFDLTVVSAFDFAAPAVQRPVPQIDRIAIRTGAPGAAQADLSDEIRVARGLKGALERLGMPCVIDLAGEAKDNHGGNCLNLVLQGRGPLDPASRAPTFVWSLHPDEGPDDRAPVVCDHLFVASAPAAEALRIQTDSDAISYLPHAFDAEAIVPRAPTTRPGGLVLATTTPARWTLAMATHAMNSGEDLRLWGDRWPSPFNAHVVDTRLHDSHLCDVFSSALAVICDHTPQMRNRGYVSHRIFDALACGVPVISDRVEGLPAEFVPFVHLVDDGTDFRAWVKALKAERPEKRARRCAFAVSMRQKHSYDARAAEIIDVARRKGYILPETLMIQNG